MSLVDISHIDVYDYDGRNTVFIRGYRQRIIERLVASGYRIRRMDYIDGKVFSETFRVLFRDTDDTLMFYLKWKN